MSQIYEDLQTMEATRLKSRATDRDNLGVMEMPAQRQDHPFELEVPLTVYGRAASGSPFYQEAIAVSGNADGGLIVLHVRVCEGQDLLLINNRSSIEQVCRVMHVRSREAGSNVVGVAFSSPNPEFWLVPEFPCNLNEKPWDADF